MTRKPRRKSAADALKIMDAAFGAKDPHWKEHVDEERQKLAIGMLIRETRESLELTQVELARRVGTTQSVISRIEDANYGGLKIETLQRIAMALGLPLAITLGPRSIQLQPV